MTDSATFSLTGTDFEVEERRRQSVAQQPEESPRTEPAGWVNPPSDLVSFSSLTFSAQKRTRLLLEVAGFVSVVHQILEPSVSNEVNQAAESNTYSAQAEKPWIKKLYQQAKPWFQRVPDKELWCAVEVLRRTRSIIRNRFKGKLSELECDLPARVSLSCLRAKGLEPSDYKHDPGTYCVMKMDSLIYRTSSLKSLSPAWSESFDFIVQDVNSVMNISVWDDFVDDGRSDSIFGKAYLFSSELLRAEPCVMEKTLLDSKGNKAGTISLTLQCQAMARDANFVEEAAFCSAIEVAALTRILWILGVPREICIQIIKIVTRVISPRDFIEKLGEVQTHLAVHLCEHFWVAEIFSQWKVYITTQVQRRVAARSKFEREKKAQASRWDIRLKKLQQEAAAHNAVIDIKKYLKHETSSLGGSADENLRLARDFVLRVNPPVADPLKAAALAENFLSLEPSNGAAAIGHVKHARDVVAEVLAGFERECLFYCQAESEIIELVKRTQSEQGEDFTLQPNLESDGYASHWLALKKRFSKEGKTDRDSMAEFLGNKKFQVVKHMRQAAVDLWSYLCTSKDRETRFEFGQLVMKIIEMEKVRVQELEKAEQQRLQIMGAKAELKNLEMRSAQDRVVNGCRSWMVLQDEALNEAVEMELRQLISYFREQLSGPRAAFQEREEIVIQIRALKDAECLRIEEQNLKLEMQKKALEAVDVPEPTQAHEKSAHPRPTRKAEKGGERPGRSKATSHEREARVSPSRVRPPLESAEEVVQSAAQSENVEDGQPAPSATAQVAKAPVSPSVAEGRPKQKRQVGRRRSSVFEEKKEESKSPRQEVKVTNEEPKGAQEERRTRNDEYKNLTVKIENTSELPQIPRKEKSPRTAGREGKSETLQNIKRETGKLETNANNAAGSDRSLKSPNGLKTPRSQMQGSSGMTPRAQPSFRNKNFKSDRVDNGKASDSSDVAQINSENNSLAIQDQIAPETHVERMFSSIQDNEDTKLRKQVRQEQSDLMAGPAQAVITPVVNSLVPETAVGSTKSSASKQHALVVTERSETSGSFPTLASSSAAGSTFTINSSDPVNEGANPVHASVAREVVHLGTDAPLSSPRTPNEQAKADSLRSEVPNQQSSIQAPSSSTLPTHPKQLSAGDSMAAQNQSGPSTEHTELNPATHSSFYANAEFSHFPAKEGLFRQDEESDYDDTSESNSEWPQYVEPKGKNISISSIGLKHAATIKLPKDGSKQSKVIHLSMYESNDSWQPAETSSFNRNHAPQQSDHNISTIQITFDEYSEQNDRSQTEDGELDRLQHDELLRFRALAECSGFDYWSSQAAHRGRLNCPLPQRSLPHKKSAQSSDPHRSNNVVSDSAASRFSREAYHRYLQHKLQRFKPRAVETNNPKTLPYNYVSYLISRDSMLGQNMTEDKIYVVWHHNWKNLQLKNADSHGMAELHARVDPNSQSQKLFKIEVETWKLFRRLRAEVLRCDLAKINVPLVYPLGEPEFVGSTTELFVPKSKYGYEFLKYCDVWEEFDLKNSDEGDSALFVTQLVPQEHGSNQQRSNAARPPESKGPSFDDALKLLQSTFRRRIAIVRLQRKIQAGQVHAQCAQIILDLADKVVSAVGATETIIKSLNTSVHPKSSTAAVLVYSTLPFNAIDPSIGLNVNGIMDEMSFESDEREAVQLLRQETRRIHSSVEHSKRSLRARIGFIPKKVSKIGYGGGHDATSKPDPRMDSSSPNGASEVGKPDHHVSAARTHSAPQYVLENHGVIPAAQPPFANEARFKPSVATCRVLKRSQGHIYKAPEWGQKISTSMGWVRAPKRPEPAPPDPR